MGLDKSIGRLPQDIVDQSAREPDEPIEPTGRSRLCMSFIVDCARSLPQRRYHRSHSRKRRQQSGREPAESSITSCSSTQWMRSTPHWHYPGLWNLENVNDWSWWVGRPNTSGMDSADDFGPHVRIFFILASGGRD